MYNAFYELQREPFHVTPDPDFLFPSPAHKEALAAIIYGIEQRKGFVAITGEVGVGKTTILRSYLDFADRENLKLIYIYNSNLTFDELVTTLLQELGVAARPPSTFQAVTALHEALIDVYRKNQTVVLIVDEAQNMPIETLESIRMLSNLETVTEKLIQIMLIGQPEFDELLQQHRLRQLRQRIAIHARIGPLNMEDSIAYLEHRLAKVALGTKPVFTRNALRMIAEASEGIPRNLNILSDNALITGYGYQTRPVNTKIVKEVLADRGYTPAAPPPPRSADRSGALLQAGMAAAAVVALVAGGLVILQPEFLRGERKVQPAPPPAPVAQRTEPPQASRAPEVPAAPRVTEPAPPPPPPPRVAEPALPMPPAPRDPAPSVAAVEPPPPPPAPPRPTTAPAPAERPQVRSVPPALTPPPAPQPQAPAVATPPPPTPKPAEVARAPVPPREPAPSAPPPAATPPPSSPPPAARATPPAPAPAPPPETRTARSGAADTAVNSTAQRRAQGPVALAPPPRPASPAPVPRSTPSIAAAPPPSVPAAPAGPPSVMMPSASGSGIAPPSVEVADASAARAVPAPPPPSAQIVKSVRAGDSLWTMAEEVYGFVNPNILRRVQDANPHIRNINVLAPGQEVVFPRVQESPFDRGTAMSEGLPVPGRN